VKTKFYKKALSAVLTCAVLLSLTGCIEFDGGKKAVIEAAGVLAENMASADAATLIKNSSLDKKSKDAAALTDILNLDGKSDEEKAFYEAVEKTIEYEVDEESFSSKKGQATIDIIFTMADYEEVLKEKFTKIDDLKDAVKKADTKEIKFTAEFIKEDKEWVADNVGSKKFLKIYDYRTAKVDLALTADMVKGFIDKNMSSFWLAEGGKYVDTIFIEYSYYFDSAVVDYKDRGVKLYFKLSKDGNEVFTGEDQILGDSTIVTCKVSNEQLGLNKTAFLDAGSYKIDLYMKGDAGDELIDTVSINVEKTPPKNTGKNNSGALPGEGSYFTFRNAEFRQHVKACGWLNNDNCKTSANTYNKNVKKLTFSIQVDDLNMAEVDYKYYYSDKTDSDSLKNAMKNAIYTGSAKPKKFTEGIFYDFDYQVDQAKLGIYLVAIYEKGTNNLICLAYVGVS
jgi:hypothetical protein